MATHHLVPTNASSDPSLGCAVPCYFHRTPPHLLNCCARCFFPVLYGAAHNLLLHPSFPAKLSPCSS
ncbi:hypothetical protein M0R45_016152 [Rubus argutus]|uniref:Uncharacterized protein n=1 Tax=Rubus argutus TaxID=59490 RepID=A0AAW1XS94_RUBAR